MLKITDTNNKSSNSGKQAVLKLYLEISDQT